MKMDLPMENSEPLTQSVDGWWWVVSGEHIWIVLKRYLERDYSKSIIIAIFIGA